MIATLLCAKAGLAVAPLIVVAVVVAYLTSEALTAFVDARVGAAPADARRCNLVRRSRLNSIAKRISATAGSTNRSSRACEPSARPV